MELAHAQTQLLDSTELAKEKIYISEKKVYLSIDEALESPNAVYNLDLSRKNLKELSIEIKKFKNLKELNLSNNNLTSLQNELSGLQNLEILR
jgi:Leucine-rich repeat (LRR) protein